jgi:hypothetical protein
MNIVKFKDTVAPLDLNNAAWFNEHLRGKYAYWVRCQYIVALEDVEINDVIGFEMDIDALTGGSVTYIDIDVDEWITDTDLYWDDPETDAVNDVTKYIKLNTYVPDDDITIEELKNFRNWLAGKLLKVGQWNPDNTHILEYYRDGMKDDVVKWLTYFGTQSPTFSTVSSSQCGCNGNTNISSLYADGVGICNPETIYRSNIKNGMVALFSDIKTWSDLKTGDTPCLLDEIVKYLEQIIKADLTLVTESSPLDTFSCKCLGDINYAQAQAQAMLRNLIEAFNNIIDGDQAITKNKNKIITSLTNWATNLYENMEWN